MKIKLHLQAELDGGGRVVTEVETDTAIESADKGFLSDTLKSWGYRVGATEGQEALDVEQLRHELSRVNAEAATLRANCAQLQRALERETDGFLGVVQGHTARPEDMK